MDPQTCSCVGLRSLHVSSLTRAYLRQRCPNLKNQQSAPHQSQAENPHLGLPSHSLRTGGARDTRVVSTRRQHLTSKNWRALHHSVKRDRERTSNVTKLNVSARPKRQWVGGSQPWLQPDFLPNRTCSYELLVWILTAGVRLC